MDQAGLTPNGGGWLAGGSAIAVFALALWALMFYGRAAAVARRE